MKIGGYFIMGLDNRQNEIYSDGMNTNDKTFRSKELLRKKAVYAEEAKKIAFTQFKALAKKNIRLPFELYSL